jgi:hypothetical protein
LSTQIAVNTLVEISNPHFAKGYDLGRIWYFSSFAERTGEPDDEYLLVNIHSYCEKGLHTDPDWLAERVGFLLGMVSSLWIPESSGKLG